MGGDKPKEEIKRIKQEEEFILVNGDPTIVPKNLPRNRKIFVCGVFRSLCVQDQLMALKREGYDAEVWDRGTLDRRF